MVVWQRVKEFLKGILGLQVGCSNNWATRTQCRRSSPGVLEAQCLDNFSGVTEVVDSILSVVASPVAQATITYIINARMHSTSFKHHHKFQFQPRRKEGLKDLRHWFISTYQVQLPTIERGKPSREVDLAECLPYLFGYKPISAISRDPKLVIFGLEVYRRPWNVRQNTKWQWL